MFAALICVCACGPRGVPADARRSQPAGDDAARARARAWVGGLRFEEADPAIDCQPDCKAQERGFDYARANRIEQPGDCDLARVQSRASEDFIEGCRAYGQYIEAAARGR